MKQVKCVLIFYRNYKMKKNKIPSWLFLLPTAVVSPAWDQRPVISVVRD